MLKRGFTPGTYKEIVFNNLVKDSINGKPVATFLYSDKYSYAIASIKDGMKLMEYARKAEK